MIDIKTIEVGDKCKIVGMGAHGYAELGDIVTVIAVNISKQRVSTETEDGEEAFFDSECGAERLEKIN